LDNGLKEHVKNFVACVKEGNRNTHANVGIGANVAMVGHMGNIAYRTGEKIFWDDEKKIFNSEKANALIKPEYRAPWKLPVI
jgi:hypothetical protein